MNVDNFIELNLNRRKGGAPASKMAYNNKKLGLTWMTSAFGRTFPNQTLFCKVDPQPAPSEIWRDRPQLYMADSEGWTWETLSISSSLLWQDTWCEQSRGNDLSGLMVSEVSVHVNVCWGRAAPPMGAGNRKRSLCWWHPFLSRPQLWMARHSGQDFSLS